MKRKNITEFNKEIYLQNVAKRWKSALKTDKKVYILSPYITSDTAEDVLANATDCEIYTDFNLESFVTGASSLQTLKKLIKKGVKVYSIPKLHAKIILVSSTFVSIGSQNLTYQGTQKKEATFTSKSLKLVRFIENELQEKWIVHRAEISLKKIEDAEKAIQSLIETFKLFKNDIEEATQFLDEQEIQRKNKYQDRLRKLELNLAKVKKSQKLIQGRIVLDSNYSVWTFMPNSSYGSDLLEWENYSLHKTNRYLCIIENTGKLGWARVMKTRISYYEESIHWTNFNLMLDKKKYQITFTSNWDLDNDSTYNLQLSLKSVLYPSYGCEVFMWFNSDNLEIINIETNDLIDLKLWIQNNENLFKNIILKKLLEPFKYNENLTGVNADNFFSKWEQYELRIGKIKNQPILLFSKIKNYFLSHLF